MFDNIDDDIDSDLENNDFSRDNNYFIMMNNKFFI